MNTTTATRRSKPYPVYEGQISRVDGDSFVALLKRDGHSDWELDADISAVPPRDREFLRVGQIVRLEMSNPNRRGLQFQVDGEWR